MLQQKNFVKQICFWFAHFFEFLVQELVFLDQGVLKVLKTIAAKGDVLKRILIVCPARLPLWENGKLNLLIDLEWLLQLLNLLIQDGILFL